MVLLDKWIMLLIFLFSLIGVVKAVSISNKLLKCREFKVTWLYDNNGNQPFIVFPSPLNTQGYKQYNDNNPVQYVWT